MKLIYAHNKKLIPIVSVSLFFLGFMLLGVFILKDYGVSYDEPSDFQRGKLNYNLMVYGNLKEFEKSCEKFSITACQYPPFFSMVLYRIAPRGDSRYIYLRRHAFMYVFFVFSVFIFYLTARKIFKDWKIGLLGALFLFISPRIFGSSFINPKDIPFLSAYVIATYTLIQFLDKKNILTAIIHGLATGMAISIRMPGLIIIPITVFFYIYDLVLGRKGWKDYRTGFQFMVGYTIAAGVFIYTFFPILYTDPLLNFVYIFNIMKQFPWHSYHLYMGKDITNQIPWHYSLVWFTISSPIFYIILFLIGTTILGYKTIKDKTREQFLAMRNLYLIFSLAILPLLAVILMKSVIYRNNRQMYFIYPALLLVSLFGFVKLKEKIKNISKNWQLWVGAILVLGLFSPVNFMVRYHPYEYIYFNYFAGSKMSDIKYYYSLAGWGMEDKAGLEYILRTDTGQKILINTIGFPPHTSLILPKAERERLLFNTNKKPKYIITLYNTFPKEKSIPGKVYYSVKIGDADILTIYKMYDE